MLPVATFGEIMLRLSTPRHERFAQAVGFEAEFGGAEANVAVAIAQLGGRASFITRVPDNDLGHRAIAEMRRRRVNTSHVVYGGDRLGLYFLEHGASQRSSRVIYDRAGSALTQSIPGQFPWRSIFTGKGWFHWSGITPALSDSCVEITASAAATAKAAGLTVSFDMNYRAKLWTPERAAKVLTPLMSYVDVCICGAGEAATIFDIEGKDEEEIARALVSRFGFRTLVMPLRQATSASVSNFGGLIFTDRQCFRSTRHDVSIVDRVGAGDAMTGGLIFSLQRGDSPQAAIDFAVAAGVLKHTIPGDFPLFTLEEVEALAGGKDGGRVQR